MKKTVFWDLAQTSLGLEYYLYDTDKTKSG